MMSTLQSDRNNGYGMQTLGFILLQMYILDWDVSRNNSQKNFIRQINVSIVHLLAIIKHTPKICACID